MTTAPNSLPDDASATPDGSTPVSSSEALATFLALLAPAVAALSPSMEVLTPPQAKRVTRVSPEEFSAIPKITEMMRQNPTLAGFTADDIDDAMAEADDCHTVEQLLLKALMSVRTTRRVRIGQGWRMSYEALSTARKRASQVLSIAIYVQAIDEILALGPRDLQAGHVAVTAQEKATKALARAAKAEAKAKEATDRAAALQANPPKKSRSR